MPGIHNGIGTTFRSAAFGGAPAVNPDFVSNWDTTKAGSASNTVVLPLLSGGVYSGTIDWGDGNTSPLSYANRTHVYASSGTYTITISGTDIQGFQFNNGGDKAKILDVSNWGNLTLTTNAAFYGCSNLTVSATDAPNITTTDLARVFQSCTSLTNENFNAWDVSSVTNFLSAFESCTNWNGFIGDWDMSSVTGMFRMFRFCSSFNGDIGNWNLANCTQFSYAFQGATVFNQDISNWNTTSATQMNGMFNGAAAFNQNIGSWVLSGVTSMFSMFNGATSFNQDISGWDVSNVTNINSAFFDATSFNQDISGWNVGSVSNMSSMFNNADAFDQNLSAWDIDQVSNFTNFMTNATGLSTANYDALLVGWVATLQAAWPGGVGYPYTININFGGSQYTSAGAGGTARASLISNFGWTITDGGGV